ncbi:hypothetical protein ABZ281_24740 [Streptomyces sp. NPDC006265]|uniref:hypothetical protein n=1 Tax=Streptomyces sp. NPDC006265 TaxID=3156740 RepID=UPI0033AA29FA
MPPGQPGGARPAEDADLALEPDLLRRTWQAIDWSDHAAVPRRILPQFATVLVAGRADPMFGRLEEAGYSLARGRWQQWPDEHAGPVREFLHAWWVQSLTDPDAVVPAHQVLALCAEASGTLEPWLAEWERQTGRLSDLRLAEAAAEWEYELLGDSPRAADCRGLRKRTAPSCHGASTGTRTTRRRCAPTWSPGSSVTQRRGSASRARQRICGTGYGCSHLPTRPAGRTGTGPATATEGRREAGRGGDFASSACPA